MSKYARINTLTRKVVKVIEADSNYIDNLPDFDLWTPTSIETTKKVAGIGDTYDVDNNNFKSPQPYNSWVFNNTNWSWEAPTAMPSQSALEVYSWDEGTTSWKEE
tara:strand:+ start:1376 stop:1690 length:315 start_codon:yes stop_codon:yes gene_type:complete